MLDRLKYLDHYVLPNSCKNLKKRNQKRRVSVFYWGGMWERGVTCEATTASNFTFTCFYSIFDYNLSLCFVVCALTFF
jgi:hypothetical protein